MTLVYKDGLRVFLACVLREDIRAIEGQILDVYRIAILELENGLKW